MPTTRDSNSDEIVRDISIAAIKVLEGRREIDPATVAAIAESVQRHGLLAPVVLARCRNGISAKKYTLADGGHRLTAFRKLGLKKIPAVIISEKLIKTAELSANIDRNDLNVLQRAEAVAQLAKLIGTEESTRRGGRQPHDKNISLLSRRTGFSRKTVSVALRHAELPKTVKKMIRRSGLSNESKFLSTLVNLPSEVDQLQAINKQVRSRSVRKNRNSRKPTRQKSDAETDRPFLPDFNRLEQCWKRSEVRELYEQAAAEVQHSFIRKIFG